MPDYRNYYLLLTDKAKDANLTMRDYDLALKTPSSQYQSKIPQAKLSLLTTSSFPQRSVTASYTSSFDRFGVYAFDPSETASIKNDKYVLNLIEEPSSESFAYHTSGSPDLGNRGNQNYRFAWTGFSNPYGVGWSRLPNSAKSEVGNWHIWYHSLPSESRYENNPGQVFGGKTYEVMAGTPGAEYDTEIPFFGNLTFRYEQQAGQNDSGHSHYTNVYNSVNGKDVDIIILEGSRRMWRNANLNVRENNSSINFLHPDYFGLDGNTRVQFINWQDYGDPGVPMYYFTHNKWFGNAIAVQGASAYHRAMCAGTAAGLLNGFATGANIYFHPNSTTGYVSYAGPDYPDYNGWDFLISLNNIKNFHNNKPINPKTQKRNPTVVNLSQRGFYQYPFDLYEVGGKSSGSFQLTPAEYATNKGFRISSINKDFIFINQSGGTNISNPTVNNQTFTAKVFFFSGSDLRDLESTINDNINFYFTASVDVDNNTIHLTSSRDYDITRPKIYKGDLTDFISIQGSNPKGGTYLTTLTGGPDPSTHISKVVVKGNLVATGSNCHIHSDHGHHALPPQDPYGIDEGINFIYSKFKLRGGEEIPDWQLTEEERNDLYPPTNLLHPSGSGKTMDGIHFWAYYPTSTGVPVYDDVAKVIYRELADDGIILVCAAGNDNLKVTLQSGSEGNPYWYADGYDEDLWNTYIEYDHQYYRPATFPNTQEFQNNISVQYTAGKDSPCRFFGPNQTDSGEWIQVGAIGHTFSHLANYGGGPASGVDTQFDNHMTTSSLGVYEMAGFFPSDYSNKGAAIDVYACGANSSFPMEPNFASPNPYYSDDMHLTRSFYESIPFNTQSIINAYTQSHNNRAHYLNLNSNFSQNFSATLGSSSFNGIPHWNEYGAQTNSQRGGTSNASPRVVGMIACYLQVNPDAGLKEVRNWLKENSFSMPTNHNSNRAHYLYYNIFQTASAADKKGFYENLIYPNGGDWGPNPKMMMFPYADENPIKFEGPVSMGGINFEL